MKAWHFIGILLPLLGCSHDSPVDELTEIKKKEQRPAISSSDHEIATPVPNKTNPAPSDFQQPKQEASLKKKVLLNVPLIRQNPELRYGCEVTSLAMMLNYAGAETNKLKLFQEIEKDSDPLKRSARGDILHWGDPARGFVGDMTGKRSGYAVFDKPMIELISRYLPGRAVNFTGKDFTEVLAHLSKGYPVVVWTTGDYRLPDRWESWKHGNQVIKTPLDLHAVVLVGFKGNKVYLNDPLSGKKQVAVDKQQFIETWKAMGSRAVSYR